MHHAILSFLKMTTTTPQIRFVLDINDTLTLLNCIDACKSIDGVLMQLVAQNIYISHQDKRVSMESYIKSTIEDKKLQRKTYENLVAFTSDLHERGLIESSEFRISLLHKLYQYTWEETLAKNDGFFDSCFHLLDYIFKHYPESPVIIQSFGGEIERFLKAIKNRYPDKPMDETVFQFEPYVDEEISRDIPMEDTIQNLISELESRIQPGKIIAVRNDYRSWTSFGFGKPLLFTDQVKTFFFDDNAYRCATVVERKDEKFVIGKVEDYPECIIKVNTARALLEPNYLSDFIRTWFAMRVEDMILI